VFGPAKGEPNLIVGTERSPEEDRLSYYRSMQTTGNDSQYVSLGAYPQRQLIASLNGILATWISTIGATNGKTSGCHSV
jgi:nucleoporin NUP42